MDWYSNDRVRSEKLKTPRKVRSVLSSIVQVFALFSSVSSEFPDIQFVVLVVPRVICCLLWASSQH